MDRLYNELPSSLLDDFLKNAENEESLRVGLFEDFGEYDKNDHKLAVASCFISLMLKSIRQFAEVMMTQSTLSVLSVLPEMGDISSTRTTRTTRTTRARATMLGQLAKIDDLLERFKGYSAMLDPNERLIGTVGSIVPEKYTKAIECLDYDNIPTFCANLFLKYCRLMKYYRDYNEQQYQC